MLEDKSEIGIKRFEREIRLLKRLNHPNVIKLIADNNSGDFIAYLMPLYMCSLRQAITSIATDVYAQYCVINSVLDGVSYLHSEGVIHRDLKPENILFNNYKDVVITDLGLGRQDDSGSTTLTVGINMGTQRYCAPEQWSDMHAVDYRADIYSIGKIIEDIITCYNTIPVQNDMIKYVIDKCTKYSKHDRFDRVEEIKYILDYYYSTLFGWQQESSLDDLLMKLGKEQITGMEIIDITNKLAKQEDKEKIEMFFANISRMEYQYLEKGNSDLARLLVKDLCGYWNQAGWPFSYIDTVADVGKKYTKCHMT